MDGMIRNKTVVKWIPWVQKTAAKAFVKYDNGYCEMDDVFQEGCLAVMKRIEEETHEPFYFLKAKSDINHFLIKQIKRKESSNLPYDDELNGKREKLCRGIDVKSAISELDKNERAILILAYWQGMSNREIAKILKIPRRTVDRWKLKALRRLHEILR